MSSSSESLAAPAERAAADLAVAPIERVEAPSREVFVREYLRRRRPVILTGLTQSWLSPESWTLERVASRYGDSVVVAVTLDRGAVADDDRASGLFHRVRLRDFIASLAAPGTASLYVVASTWNFPEEFQRDYQVPPYCADAAHLRIKVWVGKAGTVMPLHRDVPHNFHVHLNGRKRWLLFPPRAHVYPRGVFSGMPNFASVDPERPDYQRFPRFHGANALGATLNAGETLFIPQGWWHHIRSLDDAVSMNFWWGGPLVQLASLASTAFKRLSGIRRDEWA